MWYQKHQPKTLSECVIEHLEPNVQRALNAVENGATIPNMLLWGPPGTGKSTLVKILADERRYLVEFFNGADIQSSGTEKLRAYTTGQNVFGMPVCLVMDELDCLNTRKQHELRDVIDNAKVSVSWLFTCNDIQSVTSPLQSRLVKVGCGYAPLQTRQVHMSALVNRCRQILEAEGLAAKDEELWKIVEQSYPDMRSMISTLQLIYVASKAA